MKSYMMELFLIKKAKKYGGDKYTSNRNETFYIPQWVSRASSPDPANNLTIRIEVPEQTFEKELRKPFQKPKV